MQHFQGCFVIICSKINCQATTFSLLAVYCCICFWEGNDSLEIISFSWHLTFVMRLVRVSMLSYTVWKNSNCNSLDLQHTFYIILISYFKNIASKAKIANAIYTSAFSMWFVVVVTIFNAFRTAWLEYMCENNKILVDIIF